PIMTAKKLLTAYMLPIIPPQNFSKTGISGQTLTIQAFLEGKTIGGKTIKAFRTIILPIMVLP
ncbi:hypothetical protein L0337_11665, partial [candidate division KSB1 bacterium]|nr:hypothetical protein [candidate division KSB1 bacterium]